MSVRHLLVWDVYRIALRMTAAVCLLIIAWATPDVRAAVWELLNNVEWPRPVCVYLLEE